MTADDIDPSLCTHIMYSFAILNPTTMKLEPHDSWADIDGGKFLDILIQISLLIVPYIAHLTNNCHFYYKFFSPFFTGGYKKVTAFKNQGAKVMIALGGWGDSAGNKYSRLVGDASSRKNFIDHVVTFIETHNFDGLDLDWEFPGCWQVKKITLILARDLAIKKFMKLL
jgi:chitinase